MMILFLKSALLGVIIAAPVGPIGTLCINRALERGFWAGFSGGLGTALGDASYALVAVAGLKVFAKSLAAAVVPLAAFGGLLLLWLGYRGFSAAPAERARVTATDFLRITIATFVLTISNPATILSFGALFAGFGLVEATGTASAATIGLGVFSGSLAWWFCLSAGVNLARDRMTSAVTGKIARVSSGLLIVFGVAALGSAGYSLLA